MKTFIVSCVVFVSVVAIVFSVVTFIVFPLKYKSEINAVAKETGISPALIASVIRAESNFNKNAVSTKGAVGLMQIKPSTAEYIAKLENYGDYDLNNPSDNIKLGTFYLRYLFDKFGDLKTVIIAYNAGEGNVMRWLDGTDRLVTSPFSETNAYVQKVLNAMNFYKFRFSDK